MAGFDFASPARRYALPRWDSHGAVAELGLATAPSRPAAVIVPANRPAAARLRAAAVPMLVLHAEGAAPAVLDGVRMPLGVLLALPAGARCWLRATGPGRWLAVAWEPEETPAAGSSMAAILAAHDAAAIRAFRPGAGMRRALVRSVEALLAGEHTALEEVRRAAVPCLAAPSVRRLAEPGRRALMARFEHLLAEMPRRGLAVQEAAERLEVAGRTLRACVSDFTGEGPARFARRHLLDRARAALLRAQPGQARVTAVAMTLGFTELGRFSVAYRGQFGEPPSATLARAPAPEAGRGPVCGPASLLALAG